jgi:hypothetical protein
MPPLPASTSEYMSTIIFVFGLITFISFGMLAFMLKFMFGKVNQWGDILFSLKENMALLTQNLQQQNGIIQYIQSETKDLRDRYNALNVVVDKIKWRQSLCATNPNCVMKAAHTELPEG